MVNSLSLYKINLLVNVGDFVGLLLGVDVTGEVDGFDVDGLRDGDLDGLLLGNAVEGDFDGDRDGDFEGLVVVGEIVGDPVNPSYTQRNLKEEEQKRLGGCVIHPELEKN